MLRLASRRALSLFYKPAPSLSLQARLTHSLQPPFSGPPTYATLFARFSPSNPSPIGYFSQKKAEENISRGIFVGIHEIATNNPNEYNVLISDIDNKVLENEISDIVGIQYLKEATNAEADKVLTSIPGFVYGKGYCMILPCVVRIKGKARWVFFIVDSGSLATYISTQASIYIYMNTSRLWTNFSFRWFRFSLRT
jgi:hypothetical protein